LVSQIINTSRRFIYSLRHEGFKGTYIKLADVFFDLKYKTETRARLELENLTIEGDNKKRGVQYWPTGIFPLRKMFKKITPLIDGNSVLVDFGCGKGRVLLVASEFGFKEVRGVEFAEELYDAANRNIAQYKTKTTVKSEFRVIKSDVVDYPIRPDENFFFMFHPFDETVLAKVLAKINASLLTDPRNILIIFYCLKYPGLIEGQGIFEKKMELPLGEYNFTLYSNDNLFPIR
jgi:SAM-dependent methyltransferase